MNAYDMKQINSILIGENLGSSYNSFGNFSKEEIILPNSNLKIQSTCKYFYLDELRKPSQVTTKQAFKSLDKNYKRLQYIPVDIEIKENEKDLETKIDKILEYTLNINNEN